MPAGVGNHTGTQVLGNGARLRLRREKDRQQRGALPRRVGQLAELDQGQIGDGGFETLLVGMQRGPKPVQLAQLRHEHCGRQFGHAKIQAHERPAPNLYSHAQG